jgi:hypothetical protein
LLDVLRKRVADSAIVFAVVYPEQPAADERIDLGAVNFDGETAITSPTSRPATAHSLRGGFPDCDSFCRGVACLLLEHLPMFFGGRFHTAIITDFPADS